MGGMIFFLGKLRVREYPSHPLHLPLQICFSRTLGDCLQQMRHLYGGPFYHRILNNTLDFYLYDCRLGFVSLLSDSPTMSMCSDSYDVHIGDGMGGPSRENVHALKN